MMISAALAEAYAAVDVDGDVWETVELDHVTMEEPKRFVRGTPIKDVFETMSFPLVPGGVPVAFTVVDFSGILPGHDEGGPTKARLRIDNVSRILQQALREAVVSDQPITVTYRTYSSKDPDNPEVYTDLRLRSVSVTALSANGDLSYDSIEMKAFPGKTYDLTTYPALFGQG